MSISPNWSRRSDVNLLAAALSGLLKSVEQACGVGAGEGVQAVRLALLDGVARDGALRAKEFGFLLHFGVPHVLVEFADVGEHAHLRNRLQPGGARFPHVSRESGHRQEVLRIFSRDVERGDAAVRRSGDMKFAALNLV